MSMLQYIRYLLKWLKSDFARRDYHLFSNLKNGLVTKKSNKEVLMMLKMDTLRSSINYFTKILYLNWSTSMKSVIVFVDIIFRKQNRKKTKKRSFSLSGRNLSAHSRMPMSTKNIDSANYKYCWQILTTRFLCAIRRT